MMLYGSGEEPKKELSTDNRGKAISVASFHGNPMTAFTIKSQVGLNKDGFPYRFDKCVPAYRLHFEGKVTRIERL